MTEERFTLDGVEARSELSSSPRVTTARLADDGRTSVMDATADPASGPSGPKPSGRETWSLGDGGRTLTIARTTTSFMGEQQAVLIFERR